jgi:hypothetical protein
MDCPRYCFQFLLDKPQSFQRYNQRLYPEPRKRLTFVHGRLAYSSKNSSDKCQLLVQIFHSAGLWGWWPESASTSPLPLPSWRDIALYLLVLPVAIITSTLRGRNKTHDRRRFRNPQAPSPGHGGEKIILSPIWPPVWAPNVNHPRQPTDWAQQAHTSKVDVLSNTSDGRPS